MSQTGGDLDRTGAGLGTFALVFEAVKGEDERVSLGEILDRLDTRAFGLIILFFSLPSIVPMPPGVPTLVGVALLIVSLQMVAFRVELWLPKVLTKQSLPRDALLGALTRVRPAFSAVERIARPRLLILTGRVGAFVIGVIVLVMAVILILPLPPGGNFPPALACAVLGIGLAERDGVIVLLGLATTAAATIAVWVVVVSFVKILPEFMDWARPLLT